MPFVLECERVKKQENRRMKRKLDKENECINLEETCKNVRKSWMIMRRHLIKAIQRHQRIYQTISFKYSCRAIVCMYMLPSNMVSKRSLHVEEHQFSNKG